MKQYIGIARDHSGSMSSLKTTATSDYNSNVESIKEGATDHGIDTVVSVIKFGVRAATGIEFEVKNSSVNSLKKLTSYETYGSTPLFDSVGELIEQLSKVPDAEDPDVSFLIMVITDGAENSSRNYNGNSISKKIKELQNTDKWSFVFRVPQGYGHNLSRLGIPEGNILEWEQTKQGFEKATQRTKEAVTRFYAARASGQRRTTSFYSDLSQVSVKEVERELVEITKQVSFWSVRKNSSVRDFVEDHIGGGMIIGAAFYQLTKPEKLQSYKLICIRNKATGEVFSGDAARDLLNLPRGGEIKLQPGDHGKFDVFIQSTSTNRKLLPNTELLYWPKVRSL